MSSSQDTRGGPRTDEVVDWTDLGREMWSFLTGREAAINYRFVDMAVEVPRDTGPDAPRATWKLQRHAAGDHEGQPAAPGGDGCLTRVAPTVTVDADLEFSRRPARQARGHRHADRLRHRARAARQRPLRLRRPPRLPRGPRAGGAAGRPGLTVTVVAPSGPLVTLGAPRTPWWQRRITGSRHIRIERGAGLWSLARGRARADAGALPSAELLPPPTLWPPAPTLRRRPRSVTTTHDPSGGGNPRLIMAPHRPPGTRGPPGGVPAERRRDHHRQRRRLRHPAPGARARHAEVRHDDADEFVLVRIGRPDGTRVNGAPVARAVLRTASRIDLGEWTLSFYREEFADHGRPYGGRVGGEIGHQRPQPSRGGRPGAGEWTTEERT